MHQSLLAAIRESAYFIAEFRAIAPLLSLAAANPDHAQLLIEIYQQESEALLDVLAANLKLITGEAVAENSSGSSSEI